MRATACIAALLAAAAVAFADTGGSQPGAAARLEITVWPRGREYAPLRWRLRCEPTSGTLPNPRAACRLLASRRKPFAPVPHGVVCTQIYGGPAVASVSGTFRGRRIHARFSRQNGCEIARWDSLRLLLPRSR